MTLKTCIEVFGGSSIVITFITDEYVGIKRHFTLPPKIKKPSEILRGLL